MREQILFFFSSPTGGGDTIATNPSYHHRLHDPWSLWQEFAILVPNNTVFRLVVPVVDKRDQAERAKQVDTVSTANSPFPQRRRLSYD
jgi:hypothetical protein